VSDPGGRGKEPDVWGVEAGAHVPLVVLCPAVVDVCRLGLHELVQHGHLLAIGLESDGVAAGSIQTVNEDGGRDMAAAEGGLVVEPAGLDDVELVELFQHGVLVPHIYP